MKPWHLCRIKCANGSICTGITLDVAARYADHAAGAGVPFPRSHSPRRLLASQAFPGRAAASQAEYRVKQQMAAQNWALAEALAVAS